MPRTKLVASLLAQTFSAFASPLTARAAPPTATVLNGSYFGTYLGGGFDVNQFLGMPYAQAPRFARPTPLNDTWTDARNATQFGHSCVQVGIFGAPNQGEDCLNLNVWQPAGAGTNNSLPVLLWIYGGGLVGGSSNSILYNMSYFVQTSMEMGTPIIAISINYRLGPFGFIASQEVANANATNIGFYDQRQALHWVQENIGAFGGDPNKVTIFGESGGAQSVAYQITAFNGRDDHLFRGAILDSGGHMGVAIEPLQYFAEPYRNLTKWVGCGNAAVPLDCLRTIPLQNIVDYLNGIELTFVFNSPVFDDAFMADYPYDILNRGTFPKIGILAGANTDEGTAFASTGLNTTWQLFNQLLEDRGQALTPPAIHRILELYPDDPAHDPPHTFPNDTLFPQNGLQWRRDASIAGDYVIHAPKRKLLRSYLHNNPSINTSTLFSYRWNTVPPGTPARSGASHGVELAYVFNSLGPGLYGGANTTYAKSADLAHRSWIAFAATLDPNNNGVEGAVRWPSYDEGKGGKGMNLVWDAGKGNSVEQDTYREAGIGYINSIGRQFLV